MPVVDGKRRFGPFELDARTGELRTDGTRVKLQGQPISVLEILLETPGELVTREQIRERLWSSNTFVDFDQNLNSAIRKLRHALGDEAETPRYIETIPRYGYRFIGQVEKDAAPEAAEEMLAGTTTVANGRIAAGTRASRLRGILPWALGGVAVLLGAVATWLLKPQPQQNAVTFLVAPPENAELYDGGEISLSPDGRTLAFVARSGPDKPRFLWVRPLDRLTAQPIPGTEDASLPFWAPDNQYIGFSAEGTLKKVAVGGGMPQMICRLTGPGATATWSRDGVILFSSLQGSLYRVPDTGGTPALLRAPDPARHEGPYGFPQFLPDGRHFLLYAATADTESERFIAVGSLDSKSVKNLARATSYALYAPPGLLLYFDQNALMARPFDWKALRFTGASVPVAENVGTGTGFGWFSVSATGVLAYAPWLSEANNQMAWFSRTGQKLGTLGPPGRYIDPALSPDGTRVAVGAAISGNRDIWVFDTRRGTASRLTFGTSNSGNAAWTADGNRILFSSNRNGQVDIYQKDADGLGSTQPVYESKDQAKALDDLSADGRYAIFDNMGSSDSKQLWVLPLFGERKPYVFVQGVFGALSARFSPNGRYVAYASNETGKLEVYVQTFPQPTGKWEISTSGGAEPMWRRDGKELFYLTLDQKLMAVDVNTAAPGFQAGIPKELFQAQLMPIAYWRNFYVASPDGQRFLMVVPANDTRPAPITVVVNWPALLKK